MKQKLRAFLVGFAALGAAGAVVGLASQGNLVLPTTGTVTGVEFSTLITQANLANASCHSGATAPANATGGAPVAGQCWYDTAGAQPIYKIYNGAQWLPLGRFDQINNIWMPVVGGGQSTIAAAASMDICNAQQTFMQITGGGTINSFGSGNCAPGQIKILRFVNATTLHHDAAVMNLPNAADITTQANEIAIAVRVTTGGRWDIMIPRTPAAAPAAPAAIEVPIGTMLNYAGLDPPSADFLFCANQGVLRATYTTLLARLTKTYTGIARVSTPAPTNLTLTGFADTHQLRPGMKIEGTGIAVGAEIASKTTNTVTMSAAATSSGTGSVTFFAFGNGNGTTTFNLPDLRGRVAAGRDDMNNTPRGLLTAPAPNVCNGDGLGETCGNQEGTLTVGQLPDLDHTHSVGIVIPRATASGTNEWSLTQNPSTANVTINDVSTTETPSLGSGNPHTRLQPTLITNCIIRVQ